MISQYLFVKLTEDKNSDRVNPDVLVNDEEQMKVVHNRWETWILLKGKEINIGDESWKTFHVMGTWYVTVVETKNGSDDKEEGDSGYP